MSPSRRVTIPGSERELARAHTRVGDVDPLAQLEVTVYLRPRRPLDWVDQEAARPPAQQQRVAREDWASAHGADPHDVAAVRSFAADSGLTVTEVDLARRAVRLHGSVEAVAGAFGAHLVGMFEPTTAAGAGTGTRTRTATGTRSYRARTGPLTVPAELGDVVQGVFGIDDRPQAHAHLRVVASAASSYTPVQVAQAYGFPPASTGAGETVGILELGGGYSTADLSTYFAGLGLTPPPVTEVGVDGGTNSPGSAADGEVMLDIEVVGAVAPGAKIAVYFAPNTDQGFLDALSTAVHDTANKPSVISISWGQSEDAYSAQSRSQMETILTEAAGLGVTVTVASGDNGSTDSVTDGQQHVDFPASAPHALACGGTSLQAAGSVITSETVWNDPGGGATGGGVSRQFPLPSYQASAQVPVNVDTRTAGRGVPDVSGDADPNTGYRVRVDGSDQTIGGTSAVAPLWAALIARINAQLGTPVGFLQPRLYPLLGTSAFRDITSGNNGSYSAGPGWDACTGLGSPDGSALLAALQAPPAA